MEATRENPPVCRDRQSAAWSPCSPGRSGTPRTCEDVGIAPCSPVCSHHWGCWDCWSAPARWCSPCPHLQGRGLSGTAKEGSRGDGTAAVFSRTLLWGGKQPSTSHRQGVEITTALPITPSPRWGPKATLPWGRLLTSPAPRAGAKSIPQPSPSCPGPGCPQPPAVPSSSHRSC